MIDLELLKKVESLGSFAKWKANDLLQGAYRSAFHGQGMEFSEVREYTIGDDIRAIDWNVTAKLGYPHVKIFREEREVSFLVCLDCSSSMDFGLGTATKIAAGAQMAAVLAYVTMMSQDKIGLMLWDQEVLTELPTRKGRSHVWRCLQELSRLSLQPFRPSSLTNLLHRIKERLKRRHVIWMISDFQVPLAELRLCLKGLTSRKHEVIGIHVLDAAEESLSPALQGAGLVQFQDYETQELIEVDLGDPSLGDAFKEYTKKRHQEIQREFSAAGAEYLLMRTDRDPVKALSQFLRERQPS